VYPNVVLTFFSPCTESTVTIHLTDVQNITLLTNVWYKRKANSGSQYCVWMISQTVAGHKPKHVGWRKPVMSNPSGTNARSRDKYVRWPHYI